MNRFWELSVSHFAYPNMLGMLALVKKFIFYITVEFAFYKDFHYFPLYVLVEIIWLKVYHCPLYVYFLWLVFHNSFFVQFKRIAMIYRQLQICRIKNGRSKIKILQTI